MKLNHTITLGTLLAIATASQALAFPNPKTTSYLCTANYITRELVKMESPQSGKIEELVTKTISSVSVDFSGMMGGGGGDIMGGHPILSKDKSKVYEISHCLKDASGRKLEPIGSFTNGYANIDKKKIAYDFEVQFFPVNEPSAEAVGPEIKIIGKGSKIVEVKPNEFIQVSCDYIRPADLK